MISGRRRRKKEKIIKNKKSYSIFCEYATFFLVWPFWGMYSINIQKRHSDCFTELQINWKNLLFMYRNKYISLLKYVDTLPPPSELDKKILLVISLHKGIWVRDGLGRRKCIIIANVNVKILSKLEQFFRSDKLNKHTTYNHLYWRINTKNLKKKGELMPHMRLYQNYYQIAPSKTNLTVPITSSKP